MIDLVSLGLCHALMLVALWRLLGRDDLDAEAPANPQAGWGRTPDA